MVRCLVRSDHPERDIVTETLLDPVARTFSPTIRAKDGEPARFNTGGTRVRCGQGLTEQNPGVM